MGERGDGHHGTWPRRVADADGDEIERADEDGCLAQLSDVLDGVRTPEDRSA